MARTTWPKAADGVEWAAVVTAGDLGDCSPGEIVGALRVLFLDGKQRLVQALTLHVSDRITRRRLEPGLLEALRQPLLLRNLDDVARTHPTKRQMARQALTRASRQRRVGSDLRMPTTASLIRR